MNPQSCHLYKWLLDDSKPDYTSSPLRLGKMNVRSDMSKNFNLERTYQDLAIIVGKTVIQVQGVGNPPSVSIAACGLEDLTIRNQTCTSIECSVMCRRLSWRTLRNSGKCQSGGKI